MFELKPADIDTFFRKHLKIQSSKVSYKAFSNKTNMSS